MNFSQTIRPVSVFLILFFCSLISPQIAQAEPHAIYSTWGTAVYNGVSGRSTTMRVRSDFGFWIITAPSNRLTAIGAYKINGQKVMSVVESRNYNWVRIAGPKGTTITVLTKAESPGTQFPNTLSESVIAKGTNVLLEIGETGSYWHFPRQFSTKGAGITGNSTTGYIFSESTGRAVFNRNATIFSNQNGTHDNAIVRISSFLQGLGYANITQPELPR